MKNACNFDNVMGNLLGMRETEGLPVDVKMLEELDNSGKARYNDTVTQWGSEIFDEAPAHQGDGQALKGAASWLKGDSARVAKDVFRSLRNPSGLFGEERIKPVIDFITQHYEDGGERQDYFDEIGYVLDGIDTSDMTPTLQEAWNEYRRFYEDGGELYRDTDQGGVAKAFSNMTSNVIKSSPTVILGNVLEGAVKLPTLYPKTFLPAISKAVEASGGNIFKKIPELEKKGVYGFNEVGDKAGAWEGLIGLTDIPLKNISYFAGKLADGDGLKAVQRVAFINRLGDMPSVYYSGTGRSAVRFLSYTINSYKMYASLWDALKQGNPAPLLTYHALAGLFGGGLAAGLPMGFEEIIKAAAPDTEDWFEENKGPLAGLIQPGNITRLGVGYDIASKQLQGFGRNVESGMEAMREGEFGNAGLETADALLRLMTFTSSPVGDLNLQKLLRVGKEVAQGELDFEEAPGEALGKLLPALGE